MCRRAREREQQVRSTGEGKAAEEMLERPGVANAEAAIVAPLSAHEQARSREVLLEDDVLGGLPHERDVLRIRSVCDVAVDGLGLALVALEVLVLDELQAQGVLGSARVLREVDADIHAVDLPPEQVVLVEEEDHWSVLEPGKVDDALEQVQTLFQTWEMTHT